MTGREVYMVGNQYTLKLRCTHILMSLLHFLDTSATSYMHNKIYIFYCMLQKLEMQTECEYIEIQQKM